LNPPGASSAEPVPVGVPGADVLARIVRAESETEYSGWRSVVGGPDRGTREARFFVARYAGGRTLVRWDGSPEQGTPAKTWTYRHRFAWVRLPATFLANYDVTRDPVPSDPVAWRTTERVRVRPKRAGRPALDLLIDRETGLVLAETYLDAVGEVVRRHAFASLRLGTPEEPIPADLPEALPCTDPAATGCEQPPLGTLRVTALPAGFVRASAERLPDGSWVDGFSDGLAALTVAQIGCDQVPAPGAEGAGCGPGEVVRTRWPGGLSLRVRVPRPPVPTSSASQEQTASGASPGPGHDRASELQVTVSGTLPEEDLLTVLRGLVAPASR
jgi:hypothetical protein